MRELFWWLWRCLPEIASQEFNESILLIPASKVLPDASLWSHRSLTAAMAGALTGFRQQPNQQFPQLPHLVTFSFSPVQELIKASRKMRDFWAGSYVLHYLSAKIAWKLAYKYGPDSLIYPSLFQQPLIDHWLRQEWPRMENWVKQPGEKALLTAGFPNVIVAILPEDVVEGAMQNARQILLEEWLSLGESVFEELKDRRWTRNLPEDSSTWNKWLKNQWQTYWTGLPIGSNDVKPAELSNSLAATDWLERLNAGWLIDDFEAQSNNSDVAKQDVLKNLQKAIAQYFRPGNNPTDWYVIAAGDGDGMGKWLKGENLKDYQDYMPSMLSVSESDDKVTEAIKEKFEQLKQLPKRMGPSTHNALSRTLLDFSNQLVPYLTEQRYAGRLIYSGGDDVLAYTNLWEWERWLWDIHECFQGAIDPQKQRWEHNLLDASYHDGYFNSQGDYWQQQGEFPKTASGENWQPRLASRPLFTMGQHKASLSFGVVIAHHSVPLAIALEHLWAAEAGAKRYKCGKDEKDAVQVKVLFGNGNVLQATSQFPVFNQWTELINIRQENIEGSLFEQAAQLWKQHPAPLLEAIKPWTISFCQRRDVFKGNDWQRDDFQRKLEHYLTSLYQTTNDNDQDKEVQNWLKLAAFMLRNRKIKCINRDCRLG